MSLPLDNVCSELMIGQTNKNKTQEVMNWIISISSSSIRIKK